MEKATTSRTPLFASYRLIRVGRNRLIIRKKKDNAHCCREGYRRKRSYSVAFRRIVSSERHVTSEFVNSRKSRLNVIGLDYGGVLASPHVIGRDSNHKKLCLPVSVHPRKRASGWVKSLLLFRAHCIHYGYSSGRSPSSFY